MILGIGVDFCAVERVASAIARARFLERYYTEAERERLSHVEGARRAEMAAGMFAAKEAAAKALGTGFAGFGPGSVEVLSNAAGMPECALTGGAASRADALAPGGWRMHVSITHDGGFAAATAILETEDRRREP